MRTERTLNYALRRKRAAGASRRAAGLVRTLVVASATLSILVVCYALYRVSQSEQGLIARSSEPRLPTTRAEPFPASVEETAEGSGVEMGTGVVGPAQDIRLTVYPREGTRARLEIEVRDWMPKAGAPNEFVLDRPTLRTRTSDGHAIRVRAREGVLEATRQRGGSLDPQRGRLSGHVVIEYDRLTAAKREARGGSDEDSVDPAEIIRIEADEVEFDFEYAKLVVPGELTLAAAEVDLVAEGLEVRFNEAAGRMASLRINRGGRLEVRETNELLGLSLPGMNNRAEERMSVGAWLRAMVERGAHADTVRDVAYPDQASPVQLERRAGAVTTNEEGVPVFRLGDTEPEAPRETVRYRARFTGGVEVRQFGPEALSAQVTADELEILRSIGSEPASPAADDKRGGREGVRQPAEAAPVTQGGADERLVVAWNGPLIVETMDESGGEEPASRVTFHGTPTMVRSREGAARCGELTFFADTSAVRLAAEADQPFILGSRERGAITGMKLSASPSGTVDSWDVTVDGPGKVIRPDDVASAPPGDVRSSTKLADILELARSARVKEPDVSFGERMRATIREITKTTFDWSGSVTRRRFRVLERAVFEGDAAIDNDGAVLRAASIELAFKPQHGWGTVKTVLNGLEAVRDVSVEDDADRLTCERLAIGFVTEPSGESRPETAIAHGTVTAVQGPRRITASDRIEVGFKDGAGAVAASTRDRASGDVAARSIRAWGDVTVVDPMENLEVRAGYLDCKLGPTREIETLSLASEDDPSLIQLDELAISGHNIRLNAADESADVPGAGKLRFLSHKDLSGETLRDPIPITITWTDSLAHRGQENRALFVGDVRAASETQSAAFECDRMMVEFVDVVEAPAGEQAQSWEEWAPVIGLWEQMAVAAGLRKAPRDSERDQGRLRFWDIGGESGRRVSKEPAYVLATGDAVAVMADHDSATGELSRRARLAGPKLSVSLRDEVSKLLIEGAGTLQLEDFRRPVAPGRTARRDIGGALFDPGASGPSKTLIEWQHAMWYDFGIEQTRFEGDVELKHFSGAALARLFGASAAQEAAGADVESRLGRGRSTFLHSDALTVDFADPAARPKNDGDRRLAALGTASLSRFEASGSVTLQDEVEGLALWSERLVYEQPRQILAIFGTPRRQARLVLQDRGRAPRELRADRMIYDLKSGEAELFNPLATGR